MTQHLTTIVWSLLSQGRNGPLLHWFPLINKTQQEKVGQLRHFRATVKRRIIVSKITSKLVFKFSLPEPQKYITALYISCVPGLELASLRTPDSPGAPSSMWFQKIHLSLGNQWVILCSRSAELCTMIPPRRARPRHRLRAYQMLSGDKMSAAQP